MLMQVDQVLTKIANQGDLYQYRSQLEVTLKNLLKMSGAGAQQGEI